MGIPVLILGEPGSGKTASLRNFSPEEIGIFNVASKPLPFRKNLPVVNHATYGKIEKGLSAGTRKAYVIDDSQYLLAFEFFDRAKEPGYQKFTEMAQKFRNLISNNVEKTPKDCIVYFLHHCELGDDGLYRAKTIGKMLSEKLSVEGLFTIVLFCRAEKDRHYFSTQSEGVSVAKSPMEMFESEIDNDLKFVDSTIRSYYRMDKKEEKDNA